MLLFFFQAEDGIRDTSVTGVQTCALPIFLTSRPMQRYESDLRPDFPEARDHRRVRSEERRVGKECRSPCGTNHEMVNALDDTVSSGPAQLNDGIINGLITLRSPYAPGTGR